MLGAETFVSTILRGVVTIGILAAVYFLIVKPVLHTTENVVHDVNRQTNSAFQHGNDIANQAQLSGARQRARSYADSALAGSQPWFQASRAIKKCVKKAGHDLGAMNKCANLGSATVSRVLSPRNISMSYADSVAAAGNGAGADQIRKCVKDAGFRFEPMVHCKTLATKLLFG